MKWLLKEAKKRPDGYMGSVMYEHGFATLALSEMWGMTRDPDDDDAIQKALEKAVEVILRSQNPGGGWRYQPQANGGEDTSCTMTVFHALASARQAGIVVPNETIAKVVEYLKGVREDPNRRLHLRRPPQKTVRCLYCRRHPTSRSSRGSGTPNWSIPRSATSIACPPASSARARQLLLLRPTTTRSRRWCRRATRNTPSGTPRSGTR